MVYGPHHTNLCYIVKGTLEPSGEGYKITFKEKIPIRKPFGNNNKGFEGLTAFHFEGKDFLLAAFERKKTGRLWAYIIDSELKGAADFQSKFGKPFPKLDRRAPDLYAPDDHELIVIQSEEGKLLQLTRVDLNTMTTVVTGNYDGYSDANYEGILPFNKGVLLVSDNRFKGPATYSRLTYFELKTDN